MSDLISIEHLHKDFKSTQELRDFAEKQLLTITVLQGQLETARQEIEFLKKNQLSVGQSAVERIIVSPERALIDEQIYLIQQRSYAKELSLEDVKKLDLLLKNSKILKDSENAIKGQSKSVSLSNEELLRIVQSNDKS